MSHSPRKYAGEAGLPPGALVHVGEQRTGEVVMNRWCYDDNNLEIISGTDVEKILAIPEKRQTVWIHVSGLHDPNIIEALGKQYNIHSLVLEDILNTSQRPKVEAYDTCLFMVLKNFRNAENGNVSGEQVSIVLTPKVILSFQESDADIFEPVKRRIRNRTGRIYRMGGDYLAYALADTVVDNYFMVIERLEAEIEDAEECLMDEPVLDTLHTIYNLKRNILALWRSVWPLRDFAFKLEKTDSPFVDGSIRIYLRDLYDHVVQITDSVENLREVGASLLDLYHSSISNRMNEVMKVLTIISTIFIPLSFVAGVYGMNFKYMPELDFRWGYFIIWGILVTIAFAMIAFFRRKNWI